MKLNEDVHKRTESLLSEMDLLISESDTAAAVERVLSSAAPALGDWMVPREVAEEIPFADLFDAWKSWAEKVSSPLGNTSFGFSCLQELGESYPDYSESVEICGRTGCECQEDPDSVYPERYEPIRFGFPSDEQDEDYRPLAPWTAELGIEGMNYTPVNEPCGVPGCECEILFGAEGCPNCSSSETTELDSGADEHECHDCGTVWFYSSETGETDEEDA